MDGQLLLEISGTVVAVLVGLVSGGYAIIRNIKADSKNNKEDLKGLISKIESELKGQMANFEKRMEKSDERWFALFERFHILDKDIGKLYSDKN